MTRTSEVDAAGDQADMAETYENYWFSMVFEGWEIDSGGLEGS